MNRIATSLAVLGAALVATTPASAIITIFAASEATTNSIGFSNHDVYTDSTTAATTVSHAATGPTTIHGNYSNSQLNKTFTVPAVTVSHAEVITTAADGTKTTKAAYNTTTTAGYTYTVTAKGVNGTATKNVPAYVATTAPAVTVHALTANAGVLSNISNVTSGAYAGSTLTSFSFLNSKLAKYVDGKASYFTLSATSSTQATLSTIPGLGSILAQPLLTGTFQFLSATAFNVGSFHVSVGDVFLSGSFTGAGIIALLNGTTASVQASSAAAATTVSFNDSAFLDFHSLAHPITKTDAVFNMNAIAAGVDIVNTKSSLRNFVSSGSTQFSSDPAPIVAIVPEPAVWGLLVVGFGMVGLQTRRRARAMTVFA